MFDKDEKSFALGRLDIVDLYEWNTSAKLQYQTYFQRQYVWREKDRVELIDTIFKGYPIPAIFICDAQTNYTTLSKTYNVLDGRQRLESIFSYLRGDFKYKGKTFGELPDEEKQKVLSYNIALVQMYIQPDDTKMIKEIFKRLNKSAYNLNRIESQSTQLVEYRFMIIGKIVSGIIQFQHIDEYMQEIKNLFPSDEEYNESEILLLEDDSITNEDIDQAIKDICDQKNISFISDFLTSDRIFSKYERQRQVNLQYFLNIYAVVLTNEYHNRNVGERQIIEFSDKESSVLKGSLQMVNAAAETLRDLYEGDLDPFWKIKTSFFTLVVVIARNLLFFNPDKYGIIKQKLNNFKDEANDLWKEYLSISQQAVNDRTSRMRRETILKTVLGI